jgi:VWFA-related protein
MSSAVRARPSRRAFLPPGSEQKLTLVLTLAFSFGISAPLVSGQVFRSDVSLRVVDVVVTARDGRPVVGLAAKDFEVIEDGERRAVTFVTPVAIPESASRDGGTGSSTDVWTNTSAKSRRVFAVVLDDLNTSASDSARARAVVRRFIERVPPGDLVALVFTGQQTGAQEFTNDKLRMLRSLDRYVGRNPVPPADLISSDDPRDMQSMMRGALQGETVRNVQRTLTTLLNVTNWLSSIEDRRKAILFVTAGLAPELTQSLLGGLETPDQSRQGAGTSALFSRLIASAAHANVAIYPVDYQGLAAPLDRTLPASGLSPLTVIAGETGGVAAVRTNDPSRLYDVLVQDSSEYYLVAYEPSGHDDQARQARRHKLVVRVHREGVTVRARTSYVSQQPSARRDAARTQLLSSPLPGGNLGVRLQASVFPSRGVGGRVMVLLEVSGEDLARVRREGNEALDLTYQVAATDLNGKAVDVDAHTISFNLSDDRQDKIGRSYVRVVAQLALRPGTYRLRAGVVHGTAHGVVAGDLDVPDFRRESLAASAVLLVSSESALVPVRREDYEPFRDRLSAAPTSNRAFGQHEKLEAYLEVHTKVRGRVRDGSSEGLRVNAVLQSASGQVVSDVPLSVGTLGRGIGGGQVVPVHATFTAVGLAVGDYALVFSFTDGSGLRLQRLTSFSVR